MLLCGQKCSRVYPRVIGSLTDSKSSIKIKFHDLLNKSMEIPYSKNSKMRLLIASKIWWICLAEFWRHSLMTWSAWNFLLLSIVKFSWLKSRIRKNKEKIAKNFIIDLLNRGHRISFLLSTYPFWIYFWRSTLNIFWHDSKENSLLSFILNLVCDSQSL